jgi:hypothetical protein
MKQIVVCRTAIFLTLPRGWPAGRIHQSSTCWTIWPDSHWGIKWHFVPRPCFYNPDITWPFPLLFPMSHLTDLTTLINIVPNFWAFVSSLGLLVRDHDPILLITPWILLPNFLIILKGLFLGYHFTLSNRCLMFQDIFSVFLWLLGFSFWFFTCFALTTS